LVDFADFHGQFFVELNFFHDLQKADGVSTLADFEFAAEAIDDEFDKVLVVNLELLALVLDFVDEDFEFDSGAVFRVNEGINDGVELVGPFEQVDVQVAEVSENELFALSVFEEEEGNEIFVSELDEFFCGHDFFLAEIVFEHESVHRGVKFDFEVGVAVEFVVGFEDFDDLLREAHFVIQVVLVGVFTNFEIQLDVLDILEFFLVLSHGTAEQSVLMQFFLDTSLRIDHGVDGLVNLGVGVVVMEFLLNAFFGHFPGKLNRSHVRKPLLLHFLSLGDHLVQLHFSHVVRLVDYQFGFVLVRWEQKVVVLDHLHDLALVER
jgi:hypothetical protein